MKATLLICKVCKAPLALIEYDDKESKSVGCVKCSGTPIVSHVDMNKIFDELPLIAPEKSDALEIACNIV